MRYMRTFLFALVILLAFSANAQPKPAADKPMDSMQILREKLKADKKLVVAANMGLTDAEAKAFWPVYEAYQKELHKINDSLATVIVSFSKEYGAKTLTDAKARALLERHLAIEDAEVQLKKAFVPKLSKVLPGLKVARYMQIENKIRAIVKYEIADEVPLAR